MVLALQADHIKPFTFSEAGTKAVLCIVLSCVAFKSEPFDCVTFGCDATPTSSFEWLSFGLLFISVFRPHTGKCIRRFGGIYAYCRYFIDRKW